MLIKKTCIHLETFSVVMYIMHLECPGSPNIYTCQVCKCQIFVQVSSVNYGMSSHTNGMIQRYFLYRLLPFHDLNSKIQCPTILSIAIND